MLGDGPDLDEFRLLARTLGIGDYVSMPGRIDSPRRYLEGCSIAFHPSQGEVGYSLSILEYMNAALPVVAPDNPSVCSATIDLQTGLIYQEKNMLSAVEKITQLIDSVELVDRLGFNAKEMVEKQYSISRTHNELVEVVKTALH